MIVFFATYYLRCRIVFFLFVFLLFFPFLFACEKCFVVNYLFDFSAKL